MNMNRVLLKDSETLELVFSKCTPLKTKIIEHRWKYISQDFLLFIDYTHILK